MSAKESTLPIVDFLEDDTVDQNDLRFGQAINRTINCYIVTTYDVGGRQFFRKSFGSNMLRQNSFFP